MRPRLNTTPGSRAHAYGAVEWGLLAATALIWGSSFIFVAEALESFRPPVIAASRLILGFLVLAAFPPARRPVARRDWPTIAVLGVIWMAIPLLLIPTAQQWIASSLAAMINGAVPLFAALIAAIMLSRAPGKIQLLGLAIGFTGVALISLGGDGSGTQLGGVLLMLLASMLEGLAMNVAVPLQQKYGALPVLLRSVGVAAVVTLPIALLSLPSADVQLSSVAAVASIGLLGTGVAYIAMVTLVGRMGATRGAVAIYLMPVVALILGVVVRDETITIGAGLGIILILLGAWLTTRRDSSISE
ncbi:MAG: EamA family transporter [bacterium]|nr:EamA family transporter [bacterium]MCP4966994.1 EamA family transporter [bacterium]